MGTEINLKIKTDWLRIDSNPIACRVINLVIDLKKNAYRLFKIFFKHMLWNSDNNDEDEFLDMWTI